MRREVAEEISNVVFGCSSTLEKSVSLFNDKLDPEDFERYRRAVAEVIATIVHGILLPIYVEYPDLRPY